MQPSRSQIFEADQAARVGKYQSAGTLVSAIKLPADGSTPTRVILETIDTPHNSNFFHEPDLVRVWGEEGFHHREVQMLEIVRQKDKKFNGVWYFFKCVDGTNLPRNKNFRDAFGDVFLVKMHRLEYGEGARALYGDVPEDWAQSEGLQAAFKYYKPQ